MERPFCGRGNAPVATRASEDGPIDAVRFSPNGKLVAIGNQYGQVTLWDPTANKDLFSSAGSGRIVHIAFMPDGKSLYTGSWDQTIRIYDTASGKEKAKLTGPKYQLFGLALSSDGKQLVSCYSSGDVTSWSTKTNKAGPTYNPVPKTSSKGECHAVAFSPDNKTLVAGFDDGTIVFMDASTGKEQRRAKVADSVNSIAFFANGKLAVGTQNEELRDRRRRGHRHHAERSRPTDHERRIGWQAAGLGQHGHDGPAVGAWNEYILDGVPELRQRHVGDLRRDRALHQVHGPDRDRGLASGDDHAAGPAAERHEHGERRARRQAGRERRRTQAAHDRVRGSLVWWSRSSWSRRCGYR